MKKFILAMAMSAAALAATPALAKDFTGLRIEGTAGVDDVTKARDTTDITYGAVVGLDAPFLGDTLTVGVEASIDNVFERKDYGASARLGVKVADRVLVYGKAGYANFRGLDGLRVGGGLDYALTDHLFSGLEYRYSDLDGPSGRHQALVKVGVRF